MSSKKKRIYSKRKEPYVEVKSTPDNILELLEEVFGVKNMWSDFIKRVFYNYEKLNLPFEDNLFYILKNIKDNQLKNYVVRRLMQEENYNPFNSSFPIDIFSQNHKNYLSKVRIKMKKQEEFFEQETLKKDFILMVKKELYKSYMIKEQSIPVNQYLFSRGFDVVVVITKEGFIFSSNPDMKKRPDFTNIYEELDKLEPETWFLHGSGGILKTINGKKSNFSTQELLKIFYSQKVNY